MIRIKDSSKSLQHHTIVVGTGINLSEDTDGFPRLDVVWSSSHILAINADNTGESRELRFLDKPGPEPRYAWAIIAARTASDVLEFIPAVAASGDTTFTRPVFVLNLGGATKATTAGSLWHATVEDTRTHATGVGGGITFRGFTNGQTAASRHTFAAIDGYKANGTADDKKGGLRLWHSPASGTLTEGFRLNEDGNVSIGLAGDASSWRRLHVRGGNIQHEFSGSAGSQFGFFVSPDHVHLGENVYYDGTWKTIKTGKGALIRTIAQTLGLAFQVYSDNTSRAADAARTFVGVFEVDLLGNTEVKKYTTGEQSGEGRFKANRLVLPVGTDKYASV